MRRRTVVLAALAAGVLVLAATGQTWVTASGLEGTSAQAAAGGGRVSPVGTALALVVMAAALALTTARRVGTALVGVLMALAGVVIASTAVSAALDPATAAASAVADVTGTTARAGSYAVTAWPWVSAAGGALAALLGLATLVAGRRWTATRRFEAPAAGEDAAPAPAPESDRTGTVDRMDAWDELSRGEDPT